MNTNIGKKSKIFRLGVHCIGVKQIGAAICTYDIMNTNIGKKSKIFRLGVHCIGVKQTGAAVCTYDIMNTNIGKNQRFLGKVFIVSV
jgi:NADH/NAD ratio-sensing transcriptional regulator Rex